MRCKAIKVKLNQKSKSCIKNTENTEKKYIYIFRVLGSLLFFNLLGTFLALTF